MKNCALLSQEMIQAVYSKQEYREHIENTKKSSRVSAYPLHYMIALNFSISACMEHAKKFAACLAIRDPALYFVTPLMLAILLAKKGIVVALAGLMTEEDFHVLDEFGFNALHLASLALPSVVSILKMKADPLQLTPWKGNYRNLSVLAGHTRPEKSKCRFQILDDAGNMREGSSLNSKELQILTGMRELREVALYDSPEGRRFLWQEQKPLSVDEELMFQNFYASKLKEYNLRPPKLTIKPSPKLSLLNSPLGLFVDEKIPPFTKLSRYGGRFKQSDEKSLYVLGKFDGRKMGGLATLVNCGYPNAMFTKLHYDGDEQQDLFSIRSLSPGEEILVSYGNDYVSLKYGKQALLGVEEMEDFFKHFKANLKKSIDINRQLADPQTINPKLLVQSQIALTLQALFPVYYPNYLLHLWGKGITSAKFWIEAMEEKNFPQIYQYFRKEAFMKECQIVKAHCTILFELEALKKKDKEGYIPALKKWILERIGILSYLEIMCAILITKEGLQTQQLKGENFQHFFESLPSAASELLFKKFGGRLPDPYMETFYSNDFRLPAAAGLKEEGKDAI